MKRIIIFLFYITFYIPARAQRMTDLGITQQPGSAMQRSLN